MKKRAADNDNKVERTCVGCRRVADKAVLLRFVASDAALVPDPEGIMPGRGAYICRNTDCLNEAYKKKEAFSRALRKKIALPEMERVREVIRGL
ncbi:MAG: YlxR family protein [Deltaproteobacteria bacterium]